MASDASVLKLNGATLGLILPGATSSVRGTGVPGLEGASWYIYRKPSSWVNHPILWLEHDNSNVSGPSGGWNDSIPYTGLYVHSQVRSSSLAGEVGIQDWFDNSEMANAGAVHTAVAGIIVKKPWQRPVYTTAAASGDGSRVTITYSGTTRIGVGHTARVQSVVPAGYNGFWKVIASSCGPNTCSISFAGATTGVQTAAGSVYDVDGANSFAGNFNCTDETGAIDPVTSCIGTEIDVQNAYDTTDSNRQRVGVQIEAATGHVGRGIFFGTKGAGGIFDRAIDFQGAHIGIGIDFSGGVFASPVMGLSSGQQIAFDMNPSTGAYRRYLTYAGNTGLQYWNNGTLTFQIDDGATVQLDRIASFSGQDLNLTANSGQAVRIGVNNTPNAFAFDASGIYPTADNVYLSGSRSYRWSTVFATNLGSSSTPVTTLYSKSVQLSAYTVSTLPTCNAHAEGTIAYVTDASSPSYNAPLTGGSSNRTLALCNGSAWTAH
jgi:hypothetical protein